MQSRRQWTCRRFFTEREIPEDGRAFFLLQKEFTDLYLRLYQQKDKAVIAEEFNSYMKKWKPGRVPGIPLSFCVCYFGEFLQCGGERTLGRHYDVLATTLKMPEFSGKLLPGLQAYAHCCMQK